MPAVRHVDWLNENAYRRYPLVDGAEAGIPNGLLVDMALPVPQDLVAPDRVFLHSVTGFGQGVAIAFGIVDNPGAIVASCTVFLSEHELNKSYSLVGSTAVSGSLGRLTIGTFDALQQAAGGTWDFSSDPEQALIMPSAIRPALRGITGFTVMSQGETLGTVSGAVQLVAGNNISFSVSGNVVVVHSSLTVQESELEDDCGCGGQSEPQRPPIRSINGILPDSNGNFVITGSELTEITEGAGGLQIDDRSSDPCCECDQVNILYEALQAVENELGQLLSSNAYLRSQIGTMTGVINNAAINQPPIVE